MMGDELVIVVDIGSASVKAGYAGDDVPTSIFPSSVSKWPSGSEAMEIDYSQDNPSSDHPLVRGLVKDWDQIEKLWRVTLDEIGLSSPESASVMLTESPHSTFEDRKMWAEMLIDTFRHPSICIGNSAPLSLFAAGRTTGIVAECGAGITSTVPVFEGLALSHAAITTNYGGQDISENLRNILLERHIEMDHGDIRQLKERLGKVYLEDLDTKLYNKENLTTFNLPDGTEVSIHNKSFYDCVEPLVAGRNLSTDNNIKFISEFDHDLGLTDQLYESLVLCDESVRRDLANNIVLSGGTSMLPGLGDRICRDLNQRFTSDPKNDILHDTRVIPNSQHREPGYTTQRKIAPWIGGSIIASLGTYKQLKITRQEWEESKDACIQTKCI